MDNQPTQPGGIGSDQPEASPNSTINPNLGQGSVNEAPTPPTNLPATDNVVYEEPRKKRKKGPIVALICFLIVLLIGGGALAAAYIINNQPANILMSALNNLTNADQVEIDGSIDLTLQDSENIGVKSLSLKLDDKAVGLSNATNATLNINYSNGNSAPAIELGEVMMKDGTLYIEANGLKDFYNGDFRDNLKITLVNNLLYGNQITTLNDCNSVDDAESTGCLNETQTVVVMDPAAEAAADQYIDGILDQIGEIIGNIDGQWIEISIDDILNSELLATIPSNTREEISDTYKCITNVLNQMPSYSNELSDLYSKNTFLNMTAGVDSFYNINIDATNLANYLNAMPNTKFVKDLTACYSGNITTSESNIAAEDVEAILQYAPQISAKFDGIFSHHLTELKINTQNEAFRLNSDLKFSYPNNINISAPAESTPVMDVIDEVYQGLQAIGIQ